MTRYRDFWVRPKRPPKGTSKARRRELAKMARLADAVLRPELERVATRVARDALIFGTAAVEVSWDPESRDLSVEAVSVR